MILTPLDQLPHTPSPPSPRSYVATGRGFAIKHCSFPQLWASYGRTHIMYGYELLLMLSVAAGGSHLT